MYGLLGFPLGHSFSKGWFEGRGYKYTNFEYPTVEEFLAKLPAEVRGFSVTIPHKQNIIPYLDSMSDAACQIGAVNCVVVDPLTGVKTGDNTDVVGFWGALEPLIGEGAKKAAILGSGGASKAVEWIMLQNGIECTVVSRTDNGYSSFEPQNYDVIVNATPLGMFPKVDAAPPIDYSKISRNTICYDLVYNPSDTRFLKLCRRQGATVIGGIKMLHLQAEAALRLFEAPR